MMKRDYNRISAFVLLDDGYEAINCNCDPIYTKSGELAIISEEYFTYNDNGKEIYNMTKITYGEETEISEIWKDYDSRGNLLLWKDSFDTWFEYEYDDNDNQIHVKNCITSYEYWLEYDNKNRLICIKDSDGNVKQWEYNPLSTHYKDNSGYESWIIYDKNGKPIRFERNSDHKQYHDICNMSVCDMYPDLLVKTTID